MNGCSVNNCRITDIKIERLSCNGFCRRSFHGTCLGFEREWYRSKLMKHFVCSDCIDIYKVFDKSHAKFYNLVCDHADKYKQLIVSSSKVKSNQNNPIHEISEQLATFDETMKSLQQSIRSLDKKMNDLDNSSVRQISIDDAVLRAKVDDISKHINSLENKLDMV